MVPAEATLNHRKLLSTIMHADNHRRTRFDVIEQHVHPCVVTTLLALGKLAKVRPYPRSDARVSAARCHFREPRLGLCQNLRSSSATRQDYQIMYKPSEFICSLYQYICEHGCGCVWSLHAYLWLYRGEN